MCQNVYHGRTATLMGQFEAAYRTIPDAEDIAAQLLKFSEIEIGDDADLQDDPTINNNALVEKRDEMDSTVSATGKHILCLNDFGWWAKLALGAPVTTGAGPYTHVFTLDLAPRPSALLELRLGPATGYRYERYLGMVLNELGWNVMEADQSFTTGLIGAVQVKPRPVAAYDAAPAARYAKSRACTKRGAIYDVDGASTLGEITKGAVTLTNDLEGQKIADGQEGFGCVLLGQPRLSGTLTALFAPGSVVDAAFAHSSKKLVMVSKNAAGTHSLTLTVPNVEFDRPKTTVKTSKGLVMDLNWRAHHVDGADPVTISLTNAVPNYN